MNILLLLEGAKHNINTHKSQHVSRSGERQQKLFPTFDQNLH